MDFGECRDIGEYLKLGLKGIHKGKVTNRADIAKQHRQALRMERILTKRQIKDSPLETPNVKTKTKVADKPSRVELLRKWKQERDILKQKEKAKQKPVFKWSKTVKETKLDEINKVGAGSSIKGSVVKSSAYKFAKAGHKFKAPANVTGIELKTESSAETVQKKAKQQLDFNFNNAGRNLRSRCVLKVNKSKEDLAVIELTGYNNKKPKTTQVVPVKQTRSKRLKETESVPPNNSKKPKQPKIKVAAPIPMSTKTLKSNSDLAIKAKKSPNKRNMELRKDDKKLGSKIEKASGSKQKSSVSKGAVRRMSVRLQSLMENSESENNSESEHRKLDSIEVPMRKIKKKSENKVNVKKTDKSKQTTDNLILATPTRTEESKHENEMIETPNNKKYSQKEADFKKTPSRSTNKSIVEKNLKSQYSEEKDRKTLRSIKKSLLKKDEKRENRKSKLKFQSSEEDSNETPKSAGKQRLQEKEIGSRKISKLMRKSLFKSGEEQFEIAKNAVKTEEIDADKFNTFRSESIDAESINKPTTFGDLNSKRISRSSQRVKATKIMDSDQIELKSSKRRKSLSSISICSAAIENSTDSALNKTLPATPHNKVDIVYVSPFVTMSRGKTSARREYKDRHSRGGLSVVSPDCTGTKAGSAYFYKVLDNEIAKIQDRNIEWNQYKEENNLPEEACDMINVAIGQCNLLISKRMQQFRSLIDSCAAQDSDPLITCEDLHGYWDNLLIQVKNLNSRFNNLTDLRSNNWEEVLPVKRTSMKPKKKVTKAKVTKSTKSTSSIRDAIKAARQKVKENVAMQKSDDGGFFVMKSPLLRARTPNAKKSLLETVLSNGVNKKLTLSPGLAIIRATQLSKSIEKPKNPGSSKSILKPALSNSSAKKVVLFKDELKNSSQENDANLINLSDADLQEHDEVRRSCRIRLTRQLF